jgi:hypothetical protein
MLAKCLVIIVRLLTGKSWAQEKADPMPCVTLWAGALPIIVSAPHGRREPIAVFAKEYLPHAK